MGVSQNRKGPNKVFLIGLFQPFSDAIKLLRKEYILPYKIVIRLFVLSPVILLFLSLLIWSLPISNEKWLIVDIRALFFMLILGFGIYPLFFCGWASNRKYALIGSIRGIAQTISYEINLALIILRVLVLVGVYELLERWELNETMRISILILPVIYYFFIRCVAETNRTPFDFVEGESELVSGFNTEFRSTGFILIFIAEYRNILFLRLIIRIIFFFRNSSLFFVGLSIIIYSYIWVWLRRTFPRYRYDKLINLAWKRILPFILLIFIFYIRIKVI